MTHIRKRALRCLLVALMTFIVPYSWAQSASPEASEQITEAPDDSTHLKHIIELNRLGNLYSEQSDYAQAEDYYLQALEEARTYLGEEHAYYGKVADNLGHLYIDLGEYSKAETYYRQIMEIRRRVSGEHTEDYAQSLQNIGLVYYYAADLKQAEQYFLQSLAIRKDVLGEHDIHYASTLMNLGSIYQDMGNNEAAEQYDLQALAIFRENLGENNPKCADVLNNLGTMHLEAGNYEQAEKYLRQSGEMRLAIYGENHPSYAASLENLGILFFNSGDIEQAEQYISRAAEIKRAILGEGHPAYAASLNNLGFICYKMGNYSKAIDYYARSIETRKTVLGENHPDYAGSLNNIAILSYETGDYAQAEAYYLRVLTILQQVYGEQHEQCANIMNNLGLLYNQLGDYDKAEKYYLQSLAIKKASLGENHPDYASSLDNIGNLYSNRGDYARAEQYYLEAVGIQKTALGENHPEYAVSLDNLGNLYTNTGDYDKAEQYYLEEIAIRKNLSGEEHPEYAHVLCNIGYLYRLTDRYPEAERCYLQAKDIMLGAVGEEHTDYIISLDNLGDLYCLQGDYPKAETYYRSAQDKHKRLFLNSLNYMSEHQREAYWSTMKEKYESNYPYFVFRYYPRKHAIAGEAYNNELFVKGLLLSSAEHVKRSILDSGDTLLIRQWNTLYTKKQQIDILSEQDPQSDYLEELRREAEAIEKRLTAESAVLRESHAQWNIGWDDVRRQLSKRQVALEFMVVPLNDDSTMYCALLLRHKSRQPELIPLFEEQEVQALIRTSTGNLTNYTYSVEGNGLQLTQLIWGKLLPRIKEGETIVFAPSGLLHQLAIEALPYDATRTIADVFNMVRVSSTRELAMPHAAASHTRAALYGGIAYQMSGEQLQAAHERYADLSLTASRALGSDTLDRGSISYLPGTRTEVENIRQMLSDNLPDVQLKTDTQANEESFKALSGTHPHIIHIATHGFYWSDSTARQSRYFAQRSVTSTGAGIDPLNRCGLLFAGAETAWRGHRSELPEGVQDGILTAKEISLMNLSEAKLVVLSACETGKGEVTGEGVFGLQRAFKQAGVESIIMSLWPVNDEATQLLMTAFYRNWIILAQTRREAFRNAQKTVREQYEEPVYWAGFILLD